MTTVDTSRYLRRVQRPGRYIGCEWNLPDKNWNDAAVRMVMAFPDLYEVGMSHLGLRILYEVVNRSPRFAMERAFAPAPDLEALLRADHAPLFSLETKRPLGEFDVIGLSLQYELCATGVLTILDLAGLPLRAAERDCRYPLVIGGGPCVYSPEPFAPFFDVLMIGEAEEAILEFLSLYEQMQPNRSNQSRQEFLLALAQIPGFYVPSLYEQGGSAILPTGKAPAVVEKRWLRELDSAVFPRTPLVPHTEIVHDRGTLELMRGCLRGCRFCQAGMIYRPRRDKALDTLLTDADDILNATGYDELGLLSLSTMDYSQVGPLVDTLCDRYSQRGVSFGLPSLRMDSFSVELAQKVQSVRKGTLTLAPEAGSQRLRDVINKNISAEDIISTCVEASRAGFRNLKFYSMIGLPFETQEDVEALTTLLKDIRYRVRGATGRGDLQIGLSVGSFVPKSQTPFQWHGQDSEENIREKQRFLKSWGKTQKGVRVSYHDYENSYLEAILARGDRRVADVIEGAYRLGARLDGWSEYFRFDLWCQALDEAGIDGHAAAMRQFAPEEALPWEHISCGVKKSFLWREYQRAQAAALTPHCYDGACAGCGLNCRKEGDRR